MSAPLSEAPVYAPSGSVIAGGRRRFPAWNPPVGSVADVSLNTAFSLGSSACRTAPITRSWSGAAWAPWVGKYGRLYCAGGGHGDGSQNYIIGYDVESRLFYLEKPSSPIFYSSINGYVGSQITGWMFGDASETSEQVGEPFTAHFYGHHIAVPPGAIPGSIDGYLFTPGRAAMPVGGQRGTKQAHKYAIGNTDKKWTMHGAPLPIQPFHSAAIYDPDRNRVVAITESEASATKFHPYIDLTTGTSGTLMLSTYIRGYYSVGAYHSAGCYMTIRNTAIDLIFDVIDAQDLVCYKPIISGSVTLGVAYGAFAWADAWNAWVYYPGTGNTIYTLKCSGNPRTDPWIWSSQVVTGVITPSGVGAEIPLSRFRYCDAIDAFLWFPHHNQPLQAIRISAP